MTDVNQQNVCVRLTMMNHTFSVISAEMNNHRKRSAIFLRIQLDSWLHHLMSE